MKKISLLSIILLALTATVAMAGSIDLVWNDYLGYTPAPVVRWACWYDFGKVNGPSGLPPTDYPTECAMNEETVGLMASFKLDANMADFFGTTTILDGQIAAANLPTWWEMWNAGSCRPNALTADQNFTGVLATRKAYKAVGGCADPYTNLGAGGVIAFQSPMFPVSPQLQSSLAGPNTFRIKVAWALTGTKSLTTTPQYYGTGITITFENTLDDPLADPPVVACPGCAVSGRITLNEILVDGVTSSQKLTASEFNNTVTWRGGLGTDPTPAKNSTWGQVKSLYR
jgi:hypothetical protein